MAYVGPPAQYDFMGATQFRLLCALGLRSNHFLLDFGCGSLRAGRLFICYLDKDRYYGIEPNKWLIDDAIKNELGDDLVRIKNPKFNYNENFQVSVFPVQFDFILAQSIFSHAGRDVIRVALRNFKEALKNNGVIAATFIEGHDDFDGNGWIYPACVNYRLSTIKELAKEAGLFITQIPWYHPRQIWFLLAKEKNLLPNSKMLNYLTGVVLFDSEFKESWNKKRGIFASIKKYLSQIMPRLFNDLHE